MPIEKVEEGANAGAMADHPEVVQEDRVADLVPDAEGDAPAPAGDANDQVVEGGGNAMGQGNVENPNLGDGQVAPDQVPAVDPAQPPIIPDQAPVVLPNAQQELEQMIELKAKLATIVIQGSKTVLLYPFQLARTLMQIGYEPVPPVPCTTLFRRPSLLLPNIVSYLKYIKSVDGYFGCYRGLTPYLLYRGAHTIIYQLCCGLSEAHIAIPGVPNSPYDDQDPIDNRGAGDHEVGPPAYEERVHQAGEFRTYLRDMSLDLVSRGIAVTLSYPLQVVTIHSMAAFVGREPHLSNGIVGIIKAIYQTHGIAGFFKGLTPRLLGEGLAAVSIGLLTYALKVRLSGGILRTCLRISMDYLIGAATYSYSVVSATMAVNGGCSEIGSNPLYGPMFSSWRDCYDFLEYTGQLRRGSNIFWRYYTGPTTNYRGFVRPSPMMYFGPNHSKSYKFF